MKDMPWYIGRFDRKNDLFFYIKVVAQEAETGWCAIDNPKKLFPRNGEVELIGLNSLQLRPNDYIAFQVDSSVRSKITRAKNPRRIYPYCDLSSIQSLQAAQSILALDGIESPGDAGHWAIRFGTSGLILVNLTKSKSEHFTLSKNHEVPEYVFSESSVVTVSGIHENNNLFYLPAIDVSPCSIHDWTPDRQYLENTVQLFADTKMSGMIVSWLRRHTDDQSGKLKSGIQDLLATFQAHRSGELLKKLEEDGSIARRLTQALINDPNITELLKHHLESIAEEERDRLRAEQLEALNKELLAASLLRSEAIEAEMSAFQIAKKNEVEREVAQLKLTEEQKLSLELEEERTIIEETLKREKEELENDIKQLKQSSYDLTEQNERQYQELASVCAECATSLAVLNDIEDRTNIAQNELECINNAIKERARRMMYSTITDIRLPTQAKVVSFAGLGKAVREHALLTTDGKRLMEQFLALMLAGECPLLYGSDIQDFLTIAESIISSGHSIRQIADPTMIAYEDLWIKAGSGLATPLYQGLLLSSSSSSRTLFAVVERTECSAIRFWLPSLKDRMNRGDIPRNFLICGTIEKENCEEVETIKGEHLRLKIENAVVHDKLALTPLYFTEEHLCELSLGGLVIRALPEKLEITEEMTGDRLNIVNTLRATKAALELALFGDENKIERQQCLVDLFAELQNNGLSAQ